MKAIRLCVCLLILVVSAAAQSDCHTYFSVVWKDHLNNVKQGLSKDDVKWMQKKMQKKYPGICYAAPDPSVHLVFYISMTQDTYHGYRTETETHSEPINGEVTDQNGNSAEISGNQQVTTSKTVPQSFDYPIFTLSIETMTNGSKWIVRHNFQKKGICHTLYGVPIHCHTSRYVIEDAIKWIRDGGLNDRLQTVLGQDPADGQKAKAPKNDEKKK